MEVNQKQLRYADALKPLLNSNSKKLTIKFIPLSKESDLLQPNQPSSSNPQPSQTLSKQSISVSPSFSNTNNNMDLMGSTNSLTSSEWPEAKIKKAQNFYITVSNSCNFILEK